MTRTCCSLACLLALLTILFGVTVSAVPRHPGGSGIWAVKDSMPGIIWKTGTYTGAPYGNQTVNVVDLDLSVVTIRSVRTGSDRTYESVLSMGNRTKALAGVNGGFFCYTTDDICSPTACRVAPKCPADTVTPKSLLIVGGQLMSANCSTRTTFAMMSNGSAMIQQIGAGKGWPGAAYAVGAGPSLVTHYLKHITQEGFCWYGEKAARTSIATTGTGHLLLVTFDEGYPAATGMTIDLLAEFMLSELHVESAMNLDGGGSSTMYYDGNIVNNPSDRSCGGCCRCVYDGVFVYAK